MEIHSHALFSKYFSESGKQVTQLFNYIGECADDEDCFVCVLMDEVESLTVARRARDAEPSDAIRVRDDHAPKGEADPAKVVNAVLTHIDQLKRRHNVLILTTSNVTETIGPSFHSRTA